MASNVNMIIICLNNIKVRELKLRKKSETSIQSYAYFEELQKKTMKLDLLCSRHMLSGLILDDLSPPLLLTLCALATGSAKHSETDQNGFFLHQGGVGAPPSGAPAPLGSPVPLGSACSSHHLHLETSMILPLDTLHTSTQKHIKNTTSLRPNHQFK